MTDIQAIIMSLNCIGPHFAILGPKGPRKVGHCHYCGGPCKGANVECDTRVWMEAKAIR